MKTFFAWVALHCILFGLCAGGVHWYLGNHPKQVLVAVDASYSVKPFWSRVKQEIKNIGDSNRYTAFALVTAKHKVHGWQDDLQLGTTLSYGPRRLEELLSNDRYVELREADEKVLITNASSSELNEFDDWVLRTVR